MRPENRPLLDKEGSTSSGGANSGGAAAGGASHRRRSTGADGSRHQLQGRGEEEEGALSLDMPLQLQRRATTGSTSSGGGGGGAGAIDIRYPAGVGPGLAATGMPMYDNHPAPASYQRFMGPLSLPASPPFESGPVMHYQQSRDHVISSYQHPHSSPIMHHNATAPTGGRVSPRPRAESFHRAQTMGSYVPQHVLDVMQAHQTPGRNHHRPKLEHSASAPSPARGGRPEPHIEEPLFDLDPDFDISAPHLMKMFNMLDRDKNGRLTYEELREGLLSMRGMHTIPPAKVDQIIRQIDKDESRDISQEEFVAAFQQLATKALVMSRKGPGNLLEVFCYDYGPDIAICRWVYSRMGTMNQGMDGAPLDPGVEEHQMEQSLDAFFKEPVDDVKPGNVRWISITGLEPAVVVRLANRYKLHPLQIEDVLTFDRERMKYVKTQHVHQLLVGRCVLTESSQGYPQIRKEQVSLFLLEDYNTVISIQKTPSEINSLLLARIMYAGSKIRLNGPRFLVYAIVDSIVDELFPILRLIRKKLKALHSDVTSVKRTSLESVHLIQHVIREANLLLLWLSPLSTVAARLQAELPLETATAGDTELKKHLEDLVDHVHALKEQTSSMVGWAKSLADEALNEQQYRMNQVIYILTMTTTIVLPAQFLTGVFGMNFDSLPLLRSPNGFYVFWLLTLGAIFSILCVFRWKNWL